LAESITWHVVVPTATYFGFAAHYGFRPDICEAADPESKESENLVGFAKNNLMVPQAPFADRDRRRRQCSREAPPGPGTSSRVLV